MKFADMLLMEVKPLSRAPTVKQVARNKRLSLTNTAKSVAKYKAAMGDEVVSGAEVGRRLGLQKASYFLRRLEKMGLIECVGTQATGGSNPTYLWRWKNEG